MRPAEPLDDGVLSRLHEADQDTPSVRRLLEHGYLELDEDDAVTVTDEGADALEAEDEVDDEEAAE